MRTISNFNTETQFQTNFLPPLFQMTMPQIIHSMLWFKINLLPTVIENLYEKCNLEI
jgi:hypothetical protein